jgi:hypothetical protein
MHMATHQMRQQAHSSEVLVSVQSRGKRQLLLLLNLPRSTHEG